MKCFIRLMCLGVLLVFVFGVFINDNYTYAVENEEYLTVKKLLDNDYINNILINAATGISRNNIDLSEPIFFQIDEPYMSSSGKIYYYIVVMVRYDTVITPNGSDVCFYDMNGEKFIYEYCGICRADEWIDIKENWSEETAQALLNSFPNEFMADLEGIYSDMMKFYNPQTDLIRWATGAYNCHSYAWYKQDVFNRIWMNSPEVYYSSNDGSYRVLEDSDEPRIGDLIVYIEGSLVNHSGIIVGYSGDESINITGNANKYIVNSKWGYGPLFRHRGDDCPYLKNNTLIKYYRLNTNDQEVMSDSNDFNRNNIIIQAKSSTVSRDQTVYACEFDFAYSGNHNITITSDVALDTTLWNVWRENYGLTCNEVINEEGQYIYTYSGLFDAGYYYLRAECVNEDDIANISVSVSQHEHAYINYTDLGDGTHKLSCDCSVFSVENHEYECSDDENGTSHTYTCSCGISINEEHDYELVSKNSTHHTYACSCGSSFTNAHTYVKSNYSSTQHKMTCPCGNIKYEDHDYCTYTDYSSSNHKSSCDCGAYIYQLHVIKSDSGIGRYLPCTFCGRMIDTEDGGIKIPIIHNKFENEESE